MDFYFMRHGETTANTKGLCSGAYCPAALTEKGRAQIESAAAAIAQRDIRPAAVLLSPTVRARETGAILRAGLDLDPAIFAEEDFLRERDFGAWEGAPFEDVRDELLAGGIGEGGEPSCAFHARIERMVARLSRAQGPVFAISHGGFWQGLHDIHFPEATRSTDDGGTPWIGNGEVYRVRLEGRVIFTEVVFVHPPG